MVKKIQTRRTTAKPERTQHYIDWGTYFLVTKVGRHQVRKRITKDTILEVTVNGKTHYGTLEELEEMLSD